MKKPVVFAALIYLLLSGFGCKSILDPTINVVLIEGPTFEQSVSIFRYTGRVKNTGDGTASYGQIKIYVFDTEGTLLAQNWNWFDDNKLAPGETSAFEVVFLDEDGAIRAKMDLSKTTYKIICN